MASWRGVREKVSAASVVLALGVVVCAQAPAGGFLVGPGTHGASIDGVPLLPGTLVLPGETITTGPGGAVLMAAVGQGGGIVALGPDSTAMPSGTGGVTGLSLTAGTVQVSGIAVTTPQGAVVDPTPHSEFVVDAGANQSAIGVVHGTVDLTGTSSAQPPLTAGHAIDVYLSNGQVDTGSTNFANLYRPSNDLFVTNRVAGSASH